MKFSVKGFAITSAILWSGSIFLVGMAGIIWPSYGVDFLKVVSSIYPGYKVGGDVASVFIGTLYGAVDAGIGGAVFAWIYNFCAD
ncbi:MAG: hypothetical protein A2W28_00570 [Gammaproteobacteria bacterium RBG_16_51_14]|nr:MAG: hypothetical protein A2W28_00570 [Gammaproteobacteria bacterium RBG_16_51_14]